MRGTATSNLSRVFVLLFVSLLFLGACSGLQPSATSSQAPAPAAPSASIAAPSGVSSTAADQVVGSFAANLDVDFEISVYAKDDAPGGDEIHFSDVFHGGKPVILNYWAGLCPPCRAEMPDFQAFNSEYRDKVTVLGLDIGPFVGLGSSKDGEALVNRLGITYLTGTTLDAKFIQKHPPLGMPTTIFMTPDGTIVNKWTGLLTKDKLAELAAELVEKSS